MEQKQNSDKISDELIEKFISNPESFVLYRGEGKTNKDGLHFTTNKEWTKTFGGNIVEGTLPAGSKIKILAEDDMETALNRGIVLERSLWDSIFAKGYDAIIGTDSMNNEVLDVIVNPKHLGRFTRKSQDDK